MNMLGNRSSTEEPRDHGDADETIVEPDQNNGKNYASCSEILADKPKYSHTSSHNYDLAPICLGSLCQHSFSKNDLC